MLFLTDGKRPVLELRLKSHSKFSHTALTGTQLCVGRKANGVELGVLGLNFGAFLSHRVGSQYRVPILASKAAFRLESSHPPPSLRCKAGTAVHLDPCFLLRPGLSLLQKDSPSRETQCLFPRQESGPQDPSGSEDPCPRALGLLVLSLICVT